MAGCKEKWRRRAFSAAKIGVVAAVGLALAAAQAPQTPPSEEPKGFVPEFDRLPSDIYSQMSDATKTIGYPGLAWQGQQVTVAFNGGNPKAWALIEAAASEWTASGGRLSLSFRKSDGSFRTWSETDTTRKADIRVGFFEDTQRNGYWSVIGVLAQRLNAGEPTLNLGNLGRVLVPYYDGNNADGWRTSYSHTVVLHEFGHALGLSHEHFHSQCQADLKLDQAVAYLMGPPNNWSQQQALFNMDAATYFQRMAQMTTVPAATLNPQTDRASVMLYSFNQTFYRSGASSPCKPSGALGYATTLSATDRQYFDQNYHTP
jgi:hypothetical protein